MLLKGYSSVTKDHYHPEHIYHYQKGSGDHVGCEASTLPAVLSLIPSLNDLFVQFPSLHHPPLMSDIIVVFAHHQVQFHNRINKQRRLGYDLVTTIYTKEDPLLIVAGREAVNPCTASDFRPYDSQECGNITNEVYHSQWTPQTKKILEHCD